MVDKYEIIDRLSDKLLSFGHTGFHRIVNSIFEMGINLCLLLFVDKNHLMLELTPEPNLIGGEKKKRLCLLN
jgi:hypothetical protein